MNLLEFQSCSAALTVGRSLWLRIVWARLCKGAGPWVASEAAWRIGSVYDDSASMLSRKRCATEKRRPCDVWIFVGFCSSPVPLQTKVVNGLKVSYIE